MSNKEITAPGIMKVLDVSTAHVRQGSNCWIVGAAMMDGEYGWLVSVSRLDEDDDAIAEDKMPAEVKQIMQWAVANGCDYVLFDQDGTQYEQFEMFEW